MNNRELKRILHRHNGWLEDKKWGVRADLTEADLRLADLRGANLKGADLDFSCLPLWCGSFDMIVDRRFCAQIAYHFCKLNCDDLEVKKIQESLYNFANEFHPIPEVKRLERES